MAQKQRGPIREDSFLHMLLLFGGYSGQVGTRTVSRGLPEQALEGDHGEPDPEAALGLVVTCETCLDDAGAYGVHDDLRAALARLV